MRPATIVIMASLLRTCFQNEDPYLGGMRSAFPGSQTTRHCPARSSAHNEDSSICCVVVCSQSAACFDLQRLLFYSPLHFFLPLFFSLRRRHYLFFFPKNALPTVISVINGRPLTTRFILDHTDLYRGEKIDSEDRCGILFQVKGPSTILCRDTVSLHVQLHPSRC